MNNSPIKPDLPANTTILPPAGGIPPTGTGRGLTVPSKVEWGLAILALVLLCLWAVRLYDPEFLDGQLLPCMALAFLPGALFTFLHRRAVQVYRGGFATGLIAFLIWNKTISPEQILQTATNWQLVLPGLLILSLQLFLGALRWQLLLRGQKIYIHYLTILRLIMIGSFFNTFIPGATGSDLYRIYRVSQESHVSTASVTASVIIDRFVGFPAMLVLVLAGVLLNLDFVNTHPEFKSLVSTFGVFFGVLALGVLSIFLASIFLQERLQRLEGRLPGGALLARLTSSIAVYHSHPWLLLSVFGVSLLAHLSTLAAFFFFASAADLQGVAYSQYLFLVFAGLTINFVPLAPGGAGQGEAAFSWMFDIAAPGLGNGPRAASMMICCRVGMLLYGVVGGIIYSLGKEHIHFSRPPQPGEPAIAEVPGALAITEADTVTVTASTTRT